MTRLELFTEALAYVQMDCGVYEIAKKLNISTRLAGELYLLAHKFNRITLDGE